MPSRRLPETDDQRSNGLNVLNLKYQATAAPARLITAAQFITLGGILSPWRAARDAASAARAAQTNATALANTAFKATVQLVSQFIQVINFAIDRGDLPASVRALYSLPVSHAEVPAINTCPDALQWVEKLTTGESQRVAAGGPPMAWPSLAQVVASGETCASADAVQSTAKSAYDDAQEVVAGLRPGVDAFIKDAWDTIEFNLRAHTPSSLRREAREWGVIYIGDEEEPPAPTPPPTPPPTP